MKRPLLVLALTLLCGTAFAQQSDDEKLALQYFRDKDFDKAIVLLEKIQNKKPGSYTYYYYYASLIETQRYDEALKLTKRQTRQFPNVQRYKVDLGYAYERSGDMTRAEKTYQELLKDLPAKEYSVRELYNAFYARLKYDYVAETIRKGRRLLHNGKFMAKELIGLYQRLNNVDKMMEEVLALLKDDDQTGLGGAQAAVQNLLLDDEDNQKYMAVRGIVQRYSQKSPANICYLSLLYWLDLLRKDYENALVLAKAIDRRVGQEGIRTYELACTAADNRDYETAIEALGFIIGLGETAHNYVLAKMKILDVKYSRLVSASPVRMADAVNLEKEFKQALDENGLSSGTMDWICKYAHLLAFYVAKPQEAVTLLEKAMASTNNAREKNRYKIDLADVQLYMGNVWDATLNYSQVDKDMPNDALGNMAKFKNAKLSFYIGEFDWAKSQLDVLSAATSKLIANDAIYFSLLISDNRSEDEESGEDTAYLLFDRPDFNLPLKKYAEADFLIFQNKDAEAMKMLDSVIALSPFGTLVDDALYQKALILIRQKNYLGAEALLKEIAEGHSRELLADDAVFKLAELYEYYLKDIPKAMEYYRKIMKDYSNSLYVVEARKRYRALRGDSAIG